MTRAQQLRVVGRASVVSGGLALAAAAALALLPLHGKGARGNALAPTYGNFGWFAYEPLPAHPTIDDLRRAGVRAPQDVVSDRRRLVGAVAGAGLILTLAGWVMRHRHPGEVRS